MTKQVEVGLFIFVLLISLQSCEKDVDNHNILGHWHVLPSSSSQGFDRYSTIDVLNDSDAIFDRGVISEEEGYKGTVDHAKSQIRFGGECLILDFNFKVIDDTTLVLSLMRYDETGKESFRGIKCSKKCCSPEEDYFKHSKVLISIPTDNEDINGYSYSYLPLYLLRIAYIGKLNKSLADVYGQSDNILLLGDKISNISDIKDWKNAHLLKVPEQARDRTRTAILCDTSTAYSTIKPIFEELKELGETNVLFGINSSTDSFLIKWVPVLLNEELDSTIVKYLK